MILDKLVGKKIKGIGMTEDHLRFYTDQGEFTYGVDADCCSSSYFYDFIGIKKLIGNVIKKVEQIEMEDDGRRTSSNDVVKCYGYRVITDNPKFGEVSSVMSFRNDSNGYYGGSLVESNYKEYIPMIDSDKDHIYV